MVDPLQLLFLNVSDCAFQVQRRDVRLSLEQCLQDTLPLGNLLLQVLETWFKWVLGKLLVNVVGELFHVLAEFGLAWLVHDRKCVLAKVLRGRRLVLVDVHVGERLQQTSHALRDRGPLHHQFGVALQGLGEVFKHLQIVLDVLSLDRQLGLGLLVRGRLHLLLGDQLHVGLCCVFVDKYLAQVW